mmetsp:Transcript_17066/g.30803  ORF Transcript_17066/g.30803 Transcript_17066/m.30803 type:complete len:333 (+) Transcript_17066:57-1055(+)
MRRRNHARQCVGLGLGALVATWRSLATLSGAKIVMQSKDGVLRKLAALKEGGARKLQVVADFDRTLTKASVGGKEVDSSFKVLASCQRLPDSFKQEDLEKRRFYLAIEQNATIPDHDKERALREWHEWHSGKFQMHGLQWIDLVESVRGSNMELRSDFSEMQSIMQRAGIPLLVFSAGIADVIEEFLRQSGFAVEDHLGKTIFVVSNRIVWNSKEIFHEFAEPYIMSVNKDGTHVESQLDGTSRVHSNENVILLGDSMSDLNMIRGLDVKHVLTVGFLNDEKHEESYKEAFDVVIIGAEAGLSYVRRVLNYVIGAEEIGFDPDLNCSMSLLL